MSDPFIGEIRMFGGNFAPAGWQFCDGSLLQISENETLFQLIGTTYGGNGEETFALPNLTGRVPIHSGTGSTGTAYLQGEVGGAETVLLLLSQMATHHHSPACSTKQGYLNSPANAVWAVSAQPLYSGLSPNVNLAAGLVGSTGGNEAHNNMAPYLCVNFIISLNGTFPQQ